MAKEFAKAFYSSGKWLKCRASYIAERQSIDGGLCEECGEALGYIVHHKITLTELNIHNPDIALNFEYLEYVCKACHDKFDGHFKPKTKADILPMIGFDEDGQPFPILPLSESAVFGSE